MRCEDPGEGGRERTNRGQRVTKSGLVEEKGKRKREDEGISDGVTDGGGIDGRVSEAQIEQKCH